MAALLLCVKEYLFMARVNCYIDGFNFYYRVYKNRNRKHSLQYSKWLDLRALCDRLSGQNDLGDVYYCTADVHSKRDDPGQSARQQVFLNALGAKGEVEIVKGQFRARTKYGIPTDIERYGSGKIEIQIFEEKGSDVNLATLLVRDGFLGRYDQAMVISNDSDLSLAISTVVNEITKPVHVVSPDTWVTNDLKAAASSNGVLNVKLLRQCQLPNPVIDANGNALHCPTSWVRRGRS